MKKNIFLLIFTIIFLINAQGQEELETLEIGFPDGSPELPENVVVGINGHVVIFNSEDEDLPTTGNNFSNGTKNDAKSGSTSTPIIKNSLFNVFTAFILGGVVATDLGIGSRELWLPDYVFDEDYNIKSLEEMEEYVKKYKHLPKVIGQVEYDEQGYYGVNDMILGQLQNLEELVLHTIEQEKKIKALEKENKALGEFATSLENRLNHIEKEAKDK